MYTPGQVAKRANIHPNTVRKWAAEYAELFTPQSGRRLFTDEDVEVFCTIAALRKSGMPPDDVMRRIREQSQPVVDVKLHEIAQEAPQEAIQVQSSVDIGYMSLQSRVEALERRVESGASQLVTGIVIGAAVVLLVVAIVLRGL